MSRLRIAVLIIMALAVAWLCSYVAWAAPVTVTGNVRPLADNTYYLGSPTLRYQTLNVIGSVRWYDSDGSNYVGFQAPALAANKLWTLPSADGTSGQALTTNGSAILSWSTVGATAHNLLSATHSDATTSAATAGDLIYANSTPAWDDLAVGTAGQTLGVINGYPTWRWPLEYLCEQMLYKVLSANLNTKPGATTETTVTYLLGDNSGAATDNNSIVIKTGTWANNPGYIQTVSGDLQIPMVGSGNAVLYVDQSGGTAPSNQYCVDVYVDGVIAVTGWRQDLNASQTVAVGAYGVHVIWLKINSGGTTIRIGKFTIQQYPYQGAAVSGDAAVALWIDKYLHVSTAGAGFPTAGANRLGVNWPAGDFGEQILSRLPLSTNYANDRVAIGEVLDTGSPITAAQGYARMPIMHTSAASGIASGVATAYGQFPHAGMTITLGAGGATRGLRPTTTVWNAAAELLDANAIHFQFLPFIARISAIGAGSNFAVGDIVFGIDWYGVTTTAMGNSIACQASANVAVDFYKISPELL